MSRRKCDTGNNENKKNGRSVCKKKRKKSESSDGNRHAPLKRRRKSIRTPPVHCNSRRSGADDTNEQSEFERSQQAVFKSFETSKRTDSTEPTQNPQGLVEDAQSSSCKETKSSKEAADTGVINLVNSTESKPNSPAAGALAPDCQTNNCAAARSSRRVSETDANIDVSLIQKSLRIAQYPIHYNSGLCHSNRHPSLCTDLVAKFGPNGDELSRTKSTKVLRKKVKRKQKIFHYSEESDRLMVEFLIARKAIPEAFGGDIWNEFLKEVPIAGPTQLGLRRRFMCSVARKWRKYTNDPDVTREFENLFSEKSAKQFGLKPRQRRDLLNGQMVRYLVDKQAIQRGPSAEIWEEFLKEVPLEDPRPTADELAEHFKDHIMLRYQKYTYDCNVEMEFKTLLQKEKEKERGSKVIREQKIRNFPMANQTKNLDPKESNADLEDNGTNDKSREKSSRSKDGTDTKCSPASNSPSLKAQKIISKTQKRKTGSLHKGTKKLKINPPLSKQNASPAVPNIESCPGSICTRQKRTKINQLIKIAATSDENVPSVRPSIEHYPPQGVSTRSKSKARLLNEGVEELQETSAFSNENISPIAPNTEQHPKQIESDMKVNNSDTSSKKILGVNSSAFKEIEKPQKNSSDNQENQ